MTPEEIETEYWASHYHERPVSEMVVDDNFDVDEIEALMENDDWEELIHAGKDRD